MRREVLSVYMIDDSDDESYMTRLFFGRQEVRPKLEHFYNFPAFLSESQGSSSFDAESSILVVDLNLRSMRGTEVIERIRKEPWGADAVAGICTGSEDPADRMDSLEAGADFFIGKPLDRARLQEICEIDPRLDASTDHEQPLSIWRVDSTPTD